MRDRDTLYKDTVKHLRVVRNIARSYKQATGKSEIDRDLMTPYEIGRLTRSCIRLGDNIYELSGDPSQAKIALSFMTYMDGLGVKGSQFSKPGISTWFKLWKIAEDGILDVSIKHDDFVSMINHVGNMLDQPLADVPGRIMLLKLSV